MTLNEVAYQGAKKTFYIGNVFGKRTIIDKSYSVRENGRTKRLMKMKCECGEIADINVYNVDHQAFSCKGCSNRIRVRKNVRHKYISSAILTKIQLKSIRGNSRNLKVEITTKDIYEIFEKQNKKCALSGLDITLTYTKKCKMTGSIDRIDSSKDYTIDNIQIIHKDINRMKNCYNQEYFIKMCTLIANNNVKS